MLLLIEKNVQKKFDRRGENITRAANALAKIINVNIALPEPVSYRSICQASIRFRENNVVRSTFNYLIIIYRDRQLINESNKRFPLKRAFSVRKSRTVVLCIKMLRIRVQSSDE